MPGLLRGVARTAVIAGTATHVSNNVSRRQARRWQENEQTQAPAQQPNQQSASVPQQNDAYAQLEKLGQLKSEGILTEEEFNAKKKQILGI